MKNIIKNILIVVVFSLISLNCSENSTNPGDNVLNDQLIGSWSDNNSYSLTFFNDGTFTDTIYFEDVKDTNYHNYGRFVRKGNYNIQNAILSLSDFYFDEVITQASIGLHMEFIGYELKIVNNKLTMKGVKIFDSEINNATQLEGIWKLDGYYCVYSQDIEQRISSGLTAETYNFYSDSSKYIYTKKYLNGVYSSPEPYSYLGDYVYNKPYLDLPVSSDYHLLVKFIGDKMFWYYDFEKTLTKY